MLRLTLPLLLDRNPHSKAVDKIVRSGTPLLCRGGLAGNG
jgi:hypothetical protein